MSETNLAEFDHKNSNDRSVMHVLYGLHTLAWFSGGIFAVIALIVNYIRRADEPDALYIDHHNYMIQTFWWTLMWLVLLSPLWLLFCFPACSPTASSGSGISTVAFGAGCVSTATGLP